MKALRYLLMVVIVALASVTAQAQLTTPFKNSENKPAFSQQATTTYAVYTTSTLMESGSSLPMAARNGVTIGASTPNDDTPAYAPGRGGLRRDVGGGEPAGDEDPDAPNEPYPVGDGVWVMMLMAAGYLIYRVRTRKREVTA